MYVAVALIGRMVIAVPVKTGMIVILPAVCTTIGAVMIGTGIVEVIVVGIMDVDPELPPSACHIDRPEKVVGTHETHILPAVQYPVEVFIAYIQALVIAVDRPLVSVQDIVHQIAYRLDKVIVDFIHIIVLRSGEI